MKTVISLKNHSYAGHFRHIGQQYQMPDAMVIIFAKIGYVREEPQFVVKRPLPVKTSEDPIVEVAEPDETEKPKRKRRYYRRRDMRSED